MSIDPPTSAAADPGPLKRLTVCHARIDQHASTLRRLASSQRPAAAAQAVRREAAGVLACFDDDVPRHHRDEEAALFPALIESMAGSDAVCLNELVDALTAEHRRIDAAWRVLRAALQRLVAGDPVPLDAAPVEAFTSLVQQHIEREERELLPMAARLLSDEELARIARAIGA